MYIFKCKMCGSPLEIEPTQSVCECKFCGISQTLPKIVNEATANLYDRANHFRRNNEFDKAEGIYELILNQDPQDAESYWSLVLCQYGIEYVEDPKTRKRIPTINRMQYTSIFDDENYKSAIKYADSEQKAIYEAEANAINEIQKGILEISNRESKFDIFISYKESDENGNRTEDSVLAYDIYEMLTKEGYKVFFSRVSLEDKIGSAYEPYIFAALNSAKIMIVLGTNKKNYEAVWVRNEWSRFLSLVKKSKGDKVLIPVYANMDPYDLPEEFAHLQAQDGGKVGFKQDLLRGIKKIMEEDSQKDRKDESVTSYGNVEAILSRAQFAVEDRAFQRAVQFYENALDVDAQCGAAYIGLFCSKKQFGNLEEYVSSIKDEIDNPGSFDMARLPACPIDIEKVNGYIRTYQVPGYYGEDEIEKLAGAIPRTYDSLTPFYDRKKEEVIHSFENDLDLSHALNYGSEEDISQIKNAKETILSYIEDKKAISVEKDEALISRIQEEYREKLDALEEVIKAESQEVAQRLESEKAASKNGKTKKTVLLIAGIVLGVLILAILIGLIFFR